MPKLAHTVDVAAPPDAVRARLLAAADDPAEVIAWFTDDDGVSAKVRPSSDGPSNVVVTGPTFTAEIDVTVAERGVGSTVGLRGRLDGRGLLRFAAPALLAAVPLIERQATEKLQAEFGEPD